MQFKLTNKTTYCEVGQTNPMRWKILLLDGDTFTDQSGWIKCKDFFNDVIAWFKEKVAFSVYSFKNEIKANDEGVYFLLNNIKDKNTFLSNLDVMNKRLKKDLKVVVESVCDGPHHGEVVVLIPTKLWDNTYYISLVSMCIRLCNYGYVYKNWEDFWLAGAPAQQLDKCFSDAALKNVSKNGFTLPEQFLKYWWYSGKEHNSDTIKGDKLKANCYTLHNCGVSTWTRAMGV